MRRIDHPWKWLLRGGLSCAALAIAYYVYSDPLRNRTYTMDATPKKIEALFRDTKPVCFGRYLIDVPKRAEVMWGPSDIDYEIVSYPGEGRKISAEISDKIKELKEEKHRTEPSLFIGVFDGPNPSSKIVVGYERSDDTYGANLYSYIRLGNNAYVQSARGTTLATRDDAAPMGLKYDKTLYKKDVAILQDVASRLRERTDEAVPTEPGICIEAGFFSGMTPQYQERVAIGFRFPEFPDVSFSFSSFKTKHYDKSNTLEWSLNEGKQFADVLDKGTLWHRIDMLQKGPRTIAGWQGDEALARMPEDGDTPSHHQFKFNYAGKPTFDFQHPVVDIRMETGVVDDTVGATHPSLSNDEAVALWNKLTSSIRLRPTMAVSSQP
ncbi:T6SS immunity protein Tli4 family protein [Vogesella sp. LIG4]|uniref:T6SS immunity protein Tli4 family protein n=1 Tax=Vogesella sp. LIG4 TaxID=1192162 RepID=UPI0008201D74|nr:T6SS immunity protein Tli4 family protein [Vogesella sp. LIG4]SCK08424.1 hypothetical protein PSELUDRAFT_0502 [Vogesella sp. LIG4]